MLDAIQQRHANERALQEALSDWQVATGDPEAHPRWSQFYANALRDALRKANYRRQETLQDMTVTDWRTAVYRELHAEEWFEAPGTEREKQRTLQPKLRPSLWPWPRLATVATTATAAPPAPLCSLSCRAAGTLAVGRQTPRVLQR
jgi:hypothetical protein